MGGGPARRRRPTALGETAAPVNNNNNTPSPRPARPQSQQHKPARAAETETPSAPAPGNRCEERLEGPNVRHHRRRQLPLRYVCNRYGRNKRENKPLNYLAHDSNTQHILNLSEHVIGRAGRYKTLMYTYLATELILDADDMRVCVCVFVCA